MNSNEPKWRGCEEDIAEILEIKNTDYSLESAKWVTDYYEIDGVWKRKAKYSINSKKKGYYAIYEGIGKEYTYNESFPQESEDKDLLSLYKDYNEDVYGLITIKDTKLNHPIMRSDYDEDFYLWHDLNKNYNSHGIPFITLESNLDCSHGNNMIYGHRLNDGDVFGELTNYSSIEYFKKHPVIETVTEKGNSKWIIFAYFLACSEDEDSFDYFEKYRFESKKDFDEYMTEVDKRNQLSVPVKKDVTDAYLTLSSCSKENTGRGNRMVVMAKRINDDFDVKECVQKSSQNENALLPKTLR